MCTKNRMSFLKRIISSLMSIVLIVTLSMSFNFVLPTGITAEAATSNSSDTRSRLGINLEGLSDWSGAKMFTDLMKTSRTWGTADSPWTALSSSQVDQYGWPTVNDCGVVVTADNTVDAGTYKLTFESNSTNIQISPCACSFSVKNVTYGANNKITADIVVPSGQTNFMISFRNTNGGVRNMTLIRPGYAASDLFTNEFLTFIQPFSTIRFMDYLNTNGQNTWGDVTEIEWANRKTTKHASQAATTGKAIGGCWEYLVELVNQTNKDAWINIPYNASDDYIEKLANFLKTNVEEGINVYVELSNEVWNSSFPQANVNTTLAQNDSVANEYDLQYAKQVGNIAEIFRDIYGQAAMNNNIRVVLAWQIGWYPSDYMPRRMLNYINTHYDTPSNLIYALAGAPYFSEPLPEDSTSVDAVHNYMIQSSDNSVSGKKTFIKAAVDWGLRGGAVCYEGGPHHQGQVDTNLDIRMAAHRDAKMQEILIRDLKTNWFDIGGGLFCYFSATGSYSRYGCWALSEKVTDLDTPKYKAIMQLYNENTQCPAVNPSYTPHTSAPSTPKPSATAKPTSALDNAEVVYKYDFENNTTGTVWEGFSIVNDPTEASNKVLSRTDTSWTGKTSGYFLTNCDPNQTYTIQFRVYGDAAHIALSYGQNWETVETSSKTDTAKGIVAVSRQYYEGLYERPVANKWDTYVATFNGYSQYKFYIMTQCDSVINNGTVLIDDIKVYKGDYFAEVKEEIEASPTPSPTSKPSATATAKPTTTAKPSATATAKPSPTTTAKPSPTPTPSQNTGADEKDLVYSADFNSGSSGSVWSGLTVVDDPKDATNKVLSHTETGWQAKLSEELLSDCDPEQTYTIQFRVYGDAAHIALSFGQGHELVITNSDTESQKGIVTMDRQYYEGLYVRPVANEWNTYVATFKGYSQYKLYIMTQCDNNVNGGTVLLDDIKIYKGDYFAEIMEEIEASKVTPTPTATPSNNTGANPTTTPGVTASATASALPNTTAEATAMPTVTPGINAVQKVKFAKKKVKMKVGKKKTLKVKLNPVAKTLTKEAKKVKWSINKKGRKVVKFVKKAKKLNGKFKAKIKALKKGKAKITCKAPSGKKAVCRVTVK